MFPIKGTKTSQQLLKPKTSLTCISKRPGANAPRYEEREPKIVIIGAGAAGIACATKLIEFGFKDVHILEAQDRIGGRIHTIRGADNVYDMGAQWCHGELGNVVYETVKKRNLLASSGDVCVTYECIRSNGEVIPEAITQRLKQIIKDIFETKHKYMKMYDGSVASFLERQYQSQLKLPENSDIDKRIAREFLVNMNKVQSSESAASLNEVSACGLLQYWECEGDYLLNFKTLGFKQFLHVLMKSDQRDNELGVLNSRIIFNTKVSKILWNLEDGHVELISNKGSFSADHVVLTVSLGVLKENYQTMFCPDLPKETRRAIRGIGFGAATKIFIEFPQAFWPHTWTGFSALWREEDARKLRGTSREWLIDVYGFYCVNFQPRVLEAWIVGTSAQHAETLLKKELTECCMYLLRRYLINWTIPDPLNIEISKWSLNPEFRGAYSYRSLLTEMSHTKALELSNPLSVIGYAPVLDPIRFMDTAESTRTLTIRPVVLFAGEATSEHYYSTVHGAVETGWREAKRLAGYYCKGL